MYWLKLPYNRDSVAYFYKSNNNLVTISLALALLLSVFLLFAYFIMSSMPCSLHKIDLEIYYDQLDQLVHFKRKSTQATCLSKPYS